MNEELEVLKEVTWRLDEAKITYLVSGSMAANYYTIPRMTRDIDLVIEMKVEDVGRFIDIFKNDFFLDEEMVKSEVLKGGMFNLIHNRHIIKIDFILRKFSSWQQAMFDRRKKKDIGGACVWMISAEDLIIAKLLWAKDSLSEMQLKDVSHLIKSVTSLDKAYLGQWIKSLGLEAGYQKVLP